MACGGGHGDSGLALDVFQGEALDVQVAVRTEAPDDAPVDLTGCSMVFTARREIGAPDPPAIRLSSADPGEIEITDAPGGRAVIHLVAADTAIEAGSYTYDLWIDCGGAPHLVVPPSCLTIQTPVGGP